MDTNAVIAIVGGVVVAFIIRVFNVVVEWLARILGVQPPEPIPDVGSKIGDRSTKSHIDRTGKLGVEPVEEAPDP